MADTLTTPYLIDAENPWPGLAWFGESAAEFFNGRRREVAELRRLVADEPLTVLFGRSGLGKTSLLKAGLFPVLRQSRFLPVYLRIDFTQTAADTPPLIEQLFSAFTRACAEVGAEAPPRAPAESLWEDLHRSGLKVWSPQQMPLVPVFVLDQFEEVCTLGEAHPAAVARLREDLAESRREPHPGRHRTTARVGGRRRGVVASGAALPVPLVLPRGFRHGVRTLA